jgi:hypothetical protein
MPIHTSTMSIEYLLSNGCCVVIRSNHITRICCRLAGDATDLSTATRQHAVDLSVLLHIKRIYWRHNGFAVEGLEAVNQQVYSKSAQCGLSYTDMGALEKHKNSLRSQTNMQRRMRMKIIRGCS